MILTNHFTVQTTFKEQRASGIHRVASAYDPAPCSFYVTSLLHPLVMFPPSPLFIYFQNRPRLPLWVPAWPCVHSSPSSIEEVVNITWSRQNIRFCIADITSQDYWLAVSHRWLDLMFLSSEEAMRWMCLKLTILFCWHSHHPCHSIDHRAWFGRTLQALCVIILQSYHFSPIGHIAFCCSGGKFLGAEHASTL